MKRGKKAVWGYLYPEWGKKQIKEGEERENFFRHVVLV